MAEIKTDAKTKSDEISKTELTYEQSVLRLEKIVEILEDGKLSLDESLKLFEEGTRLAAACDKALSDAEQKIIKLNGENEGE